MAMENADRQTYEGLRGFTYRVLIVAAVVILFLFLWQIVHALLFAFIGVLLAVLWRGLAGLVCRFLPIPIHWALLIVAIVGIGLLILFIWFAGPRVNAQMSQLTQTWCNSRKIISSCRWSRRRPCGCRRRW